MSTKLLNILCEEINKSNEFYEKLFESKLRAYFSYLQSIGRIEELKTNMESGNSVGQTVRDVYMKVKDGLKLVGLNSDYNKQGGLSQMDKIYVLIVNYLHNGGSSRNFKEGSLELIPATRWETEVDYSEDVIEFGTSYGSIYGADEETAKERVLDKPWKFEHDKDVFDHDYGDDYKVLKLNKIKKDSMFLTRQSFDQWN